MKAGPHPQGGLTIAKGKREPSRGPWTRTFTIKDIATMCSLKHGFMVDGTLRVDAPT